jgi:hypothetical protein
MSGSWRFFGLTSNNWVSLVVAIFAGWVIQQKFRAWYRLRHFKGPLIASLTRLWLARKVAGGDMHTELHEINEKYGTLFRVLRFDLCVLFC